MFHLKKRGKKAIDEKKVSEIVSRELEGYITRDDLKEYLADIEKDEKKKKLWDSLPMRKKIKLLRYVVAKKGVAHGKG